MKIQRYLVSFDTDKLPSMRTDVLIVGTGVAGLRAAMEAAKSCRVTILTKGNLRECNTFYAQGGIACALGTDDSARKHVDDTQRAGHGLCIPEVVSAVVREGTERVSELIGWGMSFDRRRGKLHFGQEGGHSRARILHHDDMTGRELERVLASGALALPNVTVHENTFCLDLLTDRGRCLGVLAQEESGGYKVIWAKVVILATGGAGQVYRETTNPAVATGDGFAMALRAGAVLSGMEFVQFHPTTLYIAGAARELISEAVRGEGGKLVDARGRRFMRECHGDAELAPRDVVSRAILDQMKKTGTTNVFLDLTSIPRTIIKKRFSGLDEVCARFKINLSKDLIPVRPSAHYIIGGIRVDERATTSISNLLACGETASSGLHGANRLGSNSLLEGLVFGQRAGREAARLARGLPPHKSSIQNFIENSRECGIDIEDVKNSLKALMWRHVGVERSAFDLRYALESIAYWSEYVLEMVFSNRSGFEAQNMLTTAFLITRAALAREESRGVHSRTDFPQRDDARWRRHISLRLVRNRVSGGTM